MLKAQARTLIRRNADDCFRFVAIDFFRNYPRWSPEVVDLRPLSAGPLRPGSTARQVRVDYGRRTASTFRVSALEHGRRLTFQGVSSPFMTDYRFEAQAEHTWLTFTFVLRRLDLWMRPFEERIRRAAQQSSEQVVANVKSLIEAERSGAGSVH